MSQAAVKVRAGQVCYTNLQMAPDAAKNRKKSFKNQLFGVFPVFPEMFEDAYVIIIAVDPDLSPESYFHIFCRCRSLNTLSKMRETTTNVNAAAARYPQCRTTKAAAKFSFSHFCWASSACLRFARAGSIAR